MRRNSRNLSRVNSAAAAPIETPTQRPAETESFPDIPVSKEELDKVDTQIIEAKRETAALDGASDVGTLRFDLMKWLKTVPTNHPYNELGALAQEAGWQWTVREVAAAPAGNSILVSFEVLIGRNGLPMLPLDRASIALPAAAGPVSVAARAQIEPTLIYMLFGRLPPAAAQQPASPATAAAPEEREVDLGDSDIDLGDTEQPAPEPWTREMANGRAGGLPDLIDHVEGSIPVFVDLDDVQAPSGDVIVALTNVVVETLNGLTTVNDVGAFWSKNEAAFDWLRDMGTEEQRAAISGAFGKRKGLIEGGFADVGARRSASH